MKTTLLRCISDALTQALEVPGAASSSSATAIEHVHDTLRHTNTKITPA